MLYDTSLRHTYHVHYVAWPLQVAHSVVHEPQPVQDTPAVSGPTRVNQAWRFSLLVSKTASRTPYAKPYTGKHRTLAANTFSFSHAHPTFRRPHTNKTISHLDEKRLLARMLLLERSAVLPSSPFPATTASEAATRLTRHVLESSEGADDASTFPRDNPFRHRRGTNRGAGSGSNCFITWILVSYHYSPNPSRSVRPGSCVRSSRARQKKPAPGGRFRR